VLQDKQFPLSFCPPQIQYRTSWTRTWDFTMRGRRPTAYLFRHAKEIANPCDVAFRTALTSAQSGRCSSTCSYSQFIYTATATRCLSYPTHIPGPCPRPSAGRSSYTVLTPMLFRDSARPERADSSVISRSVFRARDKQETTWKTQA
jgi:hypothetical protein